MFEVDDMLGFPLSKYRSLVLRFLKIYVKMMKTLECCGKNVLKVPTVTFNECHGGGLAGHLGPDRH